MHQEAGVVALPVDQVAAIQFEDAGGQGLEEGAVVGDEQHGARIAAQGVFQPGDGADVQVVGGFVEQQQIRLGHQRLGQQHAPPPAAGQFGEGLFRRQLQPAQGAFHQLLQAPAIAGLQLLLDVHEPLHIQFAAGVLGQVMVLGEQFADAGQARGHHVEHRAVVGARQFLRQFADLQRRGAPDLAVIGLLLALDDAQEAGFAGAVAADDAYPLAPLDLPGHPVQQGGDAKGQGYVGELEQRHGFLREKGQPV